MAEKAPSRGEIFVVDDVKDQERHIGQQKDNFKKPLVASFANESERQHRQNDEWAIDSADRRNVETESDAEREQNLAQRYLFVGLVIKRKKQRP